MERASTIVRTARIAAGLSQAELAARAGTSQSTLSSYESGGKQPGLSTLRRLVDATDNELVLAVRPKRASDRWKLAMHLLVAEHLQDRPREVLERAVGNLEVMRGAASPSAVRWLDRWAELLTGDIDDVVVAMTSLSAEGAELRNISPFAGVLSDDERRAAKVWSRHAP